MADPFAFSRQATRAAAPAASGPQQQEWSGWGGQQQMGSDQMPAAGSMGTMGGAPVVPPSFHSSQQPGSGFGAAPQSTQANPLSLGQQHQQQIPQHQQPAMTFPGAAFSGGAFNIAEVASNPMAQIGIEYGNKLVQSSIARYLPGAAALWTSLRYYFDVNNSYVKIKLWKVVFPWLSRKWERTPAAESNGSARHSSADGSALSFVAPVHDENAPDLYIPLMSLITFVLVTGLLKGTRMKFTPEELVNLTSSSLLISTMEVIFLKVGMYLTGAEGCSVLDLVAYSGYKYVGMVFNAVVGLLFGAQAYWAVLFYTSSAMAFFVVNTLMPVVQPEAYHAAGIAGSQLPGRSGGGAAASAHRNYFVLGAALLQFVLMWWLGHSNLL